MVKFYVKRNALKKSLNQVFLQIHWNIIAYHRQIHFILLSPDNLIWFSA